MSIAKGFVAKYSGIITIRSILSLIGKVGKGVEGYLSTDKGVTKLEPACSTIFASLTWQRFVAHYVEYIRFNTEFHQKGRQRDGGVLVGSQGNG